MAAGSGGMMPITYGWILFRSSDNKPEFLGIYDSEEAAKEDADNLFELGQRPWSVKRVPFLGWGKVLFASNRERATCHLWHFPPAVIRTAGLRNVLSIGHRIQPPLKS